MIPSLQHLLCCWPRLRWRCVFSSGVRPAAASHMTKWMPRNQFSLAQYSPAQMARRIFFFGFSSVSSCTMLSDTHPCRPEVGGRWSNLNNFLFLEQIPPSWMKHDHTTNWCVQGVIATVGAHPVHGAAELSGEKELTFQLIAAGVFL